MTWPGIVRLLLIGPLVLEVRRCECANLDKGLHQYRLVSDLLDGYRPYLRPVRNANSSTIVTVEYFVVAIHEVDESQQNLKHSAYLNFEWTDQLLVWDGHQYGGIHHLEIPTYLIWTPNIMFTNSASDKRFVDPEMSRYSMLYSDGRVLSVPYTVLTTSCSIDITYYPFDSQTCVVTLESWSSPESEVNVTDIQVKKSEWFIANSEWDLTDLRVKRLTTPMLNDTYSRYDVYFHLKRRRLFHTLTVVAPNVLLALLVSLVFLLPAGAGEKMSFSMALLLAFALNLSLLLAAMPHSSLDVSVLMLYITGISIMTALSIVVSVCLLHLYHKDDKDDPEYGQPVGPKLAATVRFLRRVLRLKSFGPTSPSTQMSKGQYRAKWSKWVKVINMTNKFSMEKHSEENKGHSPTRNLAEKNASVKEDLNKENGKNEKLLKVEGSMHTAGSNNNMAGDDIPENTIQNDMGWKDAAGVLDYVFFRVFVFVIAAMTALLVGLLLSREIL